MWQYTSHNCVTVSHHTLTVSPSRSGHTVSLVTAYFLVSKLSHNYLTLCVNLSKCHAYIIAGAVMFDLQIVGVVCTVCSVWVGCVFSCRSLLWVCEADGSPLTLPCSSVHTTQNPLSQSTACNIPGPWTVVGKVTSSFCKSQMALWLLPFLHLKSFNSGPKMDQKWTKNKPPKAVSFHLHGWRVSHWSLSPLPLWDITVYVSVLTHVWKPITNSTGAI